MGEAALDWTAADDIMRRKRVVVEEEEWERYRGGGIGGVQGSRVREIGGGSGAAGETQWIMDNGGQTRPAFARTSTAGGK